jgi:lysophospholipase L1-like esterase
VLTFSGATSIAIPPGALVVSDPVKLKVPPTTDLAISIYLPGPTGLPTNHYRSLSTNFIYSPGDFHGRDQHARCRNRDVSWRRGPAPHLWVAIVYLAGVDVLASHQAGAIVTLGDSATDSFGSTVDANQRWPDVLAKRLLMRHQAARRPLSVLNAGIAGNGVITNIVGRNGLARFDRDVLAQSGVEFLIVFYGTNDISSGVTADQLIAAHRQLIERAHLQGITYSAPRSRRAASPARTFASRPGKRSHRFVRTSGEYDGVIDFDAALLDPTNPNSMLPVYDSGDHSHPNDAGYNAMGRAINLDMFRVR